MTIGEIAALIAACSFLLLVFAVIVFLMRATRSLTVMTRDVDMLAHSSNEVLANTNVLMTDIAGKLETLDPAVVALADLSTTVSGLNASVNRMGERFSAKKTAASVGATGVASMFAKKAFGRLLKKRRKKSPQA